MTNETTSQLKEKLQGSPSMKELLQDKSISFFMPKAGDIIDGKVIEKARNRIYFDLGALRTGVTYKSEIDLSLYDMQSIKEGDVLPVKVIELENEEGLVELSLREAGLDRVWQELKDLKETGEVFKVTVTEANRGGILAQVKGVVGFLPVSQLSPENYPHVEGGDREEIFKRLKDFIGKSLEVKILDLDQKNSKLILSERAKVSKAIQEKLVNFSVGQTVQGKISGIVDFGAFVTFSDIEGLVHISELGWQLVENPEDVATIGQEVSAKIIAIENDKVSLSLKALKANPWHEIAERYKKGDVIDCVVNKFNPFGAFIKVGPEIQGLAHISEFKNYDHMLSSIEIGKSYPFRITLLEPKDYRMALRLVSLEEDKTTQEKIEDVVPAKPEESLTDFPKEEKVSDDSNESVTKDETPVSPSSQGGANLDPVI